MEKTRSTQHTHTNRAAADARRQVNVTRNGFIILPSIILSFLRRLLSFICPFSEWLVVSPFAGEVTPDRVLGYLSGVPEVYGADSRPKKLEWMIRQTKSIAGK